MEAIWHKVCTHYNVPENVANDWFQRIKEKLSAAFPTRSYHNWQEMMLRKQEYLEKSKPSIVLAAFFQYYHFYGNRSCVMENCAIFEQFCVDAMIEDEETKALVRNLLGQKSPDGELTMCYENEANLLQDLDLAILAAPPDEYKHYTELLRREYEHLNDKNYRMMRLKVLETLLIIPAIYATTEFHDKYESTARSNIQNEINELKQQSIA